MNATAIKEEFPLMTYMSLCQTDPTRAMNTHVHVLDLINKFNYGGMQQFSQTLISKLTALNENAYEYLNDKFKSENQKNKLRNEGSFSTGLGVNLDSIGDMLKVHLGVTTNYSETHYYADNLGKLEIARRTAVGLAQYNNESFIVLRYGVTLDDNYIGYKSIDFEVTRGLWKKWTLYLSYMIGLAKVIIEPNNGNRDYIFEFIDENVVLTTKLSVGEKYEISIRSRKQENIKWISNPYSSQNRSV